MIKKINILVQSLLFANMKYVLLLINFLFVTTLVFSSDEIPPESSPLAVGCPTLSVTGTPVSCYAGSNGTVALLINGSSSVSGYTVTWSNGSNNVSSLSGLPAGAYTVNVKDNVSGCTAFGAYVVNEPTPFEVSGTVTNVNCFGQATGFIDITVSGATPPYTYVWSNTTGTGNPQDLTNAPVGNPTVTIKDSKNCSTSKAYTITGPIQAITTSISHTNTSCYGGANGSVDLTVWGGTFPYSYVWSNAASSQDISGLNSGNYSVTITDSKGCNIGNSVTITQPADITLGMNSAPVDCYGNSSGKVWVLPAGGTTPYSYQWSNTSDVFGINNDTLIGVVADTYNLTLIDKNGCIKNGTVDVQQPSELMISVSSFQNVKCHGDASGSINLNTSGAISPYTFNWTNQFTTTVGSSQNLVNIPANTYSVLVTDQNGCTKSLSQIITEPSSNLTAIQTQQNVNCFGMATGSINVTPNGGTTPYSFSWSNGATTEDVSNLLAGNYNYLLTDFNGCTFAGGPIVITQPAAALSNVYAVTDVNCFGESNGAVNLTPAGGTIPYTYTWHNSSYLMSMITEDVSNLPADTYTFLITDAKGCTYSNAATVNQPTELISTISGVNILCKGGNNGSVDLTVSGGTIAYTYTWNNGATSEDLLNLYAGTYSVIVLDNHGCSTSNQITLTEPASALDYDSVITDVKCNNGVDGAISIAVMGGTTPYGYNWSNGGTFSTATDLAAGNYSFIVTDNNGCILKDTLYVSEPDPLAMNEVITPVTCFGLHNGSIDVNPVGGTLPYKYTWYNSNYALSAQTQDLINFPADTFELEILDSNNCYYEMFWNLPEPTILKASFTSDNVKCAGGSDGDILVDVIGGNGGYTYSWSNGATTQDVLNVPVGIYSFMVTDAKNCKDSLHVQIFQPLPVSATFDLIPVSCKDQYDGIAIVHAKGGTGNYEYLWSTNEMTATISNLPTASYKIHISDVLGCIFDTTVFVDKSSEFCVYPPNAFTPNGDDYNDTWMIDNLEVYPDLELQVFNKWGNLVYKRTGLYEPWDGKISGSTAPSDTYYYIMYLNNTDNDKIKGSITILK